MSSCPASQHCPYTPESCPFGCQVIDIELIEVEESEKVMTEVFMICDAYESGVGKGLQNSKFKSGPFEEGSDEQEAYAIGYKLGHKKYTERNLNNDF